MVPLRFLKCWNGHDRGAEVDFAHPGLAEELVRMNIAEVRSDEKKPGGVSAQTSGSKRRQKAKD